MLEVGQSYSTVGGKRVTIIYEDGGYSYGGVTYAFIGLVHDYNAHGTRITRYRENGTSTSGEFNIDTRPIRYFIIHHDGKGPRLLDELPPDLPENLIVAKIIFNTATENTAIAGIPLFKAGVVIPDDELKAAIFVGETYKDSAARDVRIISNDATKQSGGILFPYIGLIGGQTIDFYTKSGKSFSGYNLGPAAKQLHVTLAPDLTFEIVDDIKRPAPPPLHSQFTLVMNGDGTCGNCIYQNAGRHNLA